MSTSLSVNTRIPFCCLLKSHLTLFVYSSAGMAMLRLGATRPSRYGYGLLRHSGRSWQNMAVFFKCLCCGASSYRGCTDIFWPKLAPIFFLLLGLQDGGGSQWKCRLQRWNGRSKKISHDRQNGCPGIISYERQWHFALRFGCQNGCSEKISRERPKRLARNNLLRVPVALCSSFWTHPCKGWLLQL